MAKIHCYFVTERGTVSAGNWASLLALFDAMGTQGSPFPMYNNHKRARLDGDAVIYESNFDTTEVSVDAFKQMLADEFGVDIGDIDDIQSQDNYAGIGTVTWAFLYGAIERFVVRRFGGGGAAWEQSRVEAIGYLKLYQNEWESQL